jgi:hypothetical protein
MIIVSTVESSREAVPGSEAEEEVSTAAAW